MLYYPQCLISSQLGGASFSLKREILIDLQTISKTSKLPRKRDFLCLPPFLQGEVAEWRRGLKGE